MKSKRLTLDVQVRMAYHRGLVSRTNPDTAGRNLNEAEREAWWLGNDYKEGRRALEPHTLVGCGCVSCRLARIVEKYL